MASCSSHSACRTRRKSRAGLALENHLEALFKALDLRFDRGKETENRNKPDFLFPGQAQYRDPSFPAARSPCWAQNRP